MCRYRIIHEIIFFLLLPLCVYVKKFDCSPSMRPFLRMLPLGNSFTLKRSIDTAKRRFAVCSSTFYRWILPCRSWPGDTNTSSAAVRDQMYIHACRISIKYTGRADIVGQYRPGSQVQQPILGCALKPRPLFRGCINHISLSVFKSTRGYLNFFAAAQAGEKG